ncbi:MAG TPA: single-stranded DNA-binding protein [Spirochaetota bacterium]|nr:single-stranded DNA-binding protein [Spirochaetota bacterium]HNT12810.1 single-stranded DNA-binding protein [Spirochaetota bacterium]HNV48470.1 single-stranded DNA-binding protein [Spirochaetota bacterium]HOS41263.1 single-stranded DNA-binding protein [Spirochaetota bacterium]HPU90201.1 single-stranded DNA-binding protein [Spirochaetota bacterium]
MSNNSSARVEGYVTHEPQLRTTKTGKTICHFSVAMNHYSSPEESPKVSFIDIETWEKLADFCGKSINKGRRVMVFGQLRQDRWEGKDGRIQSKIKVVGREIKFLESSSVKTGDDASAN